MSKVSVDRELLDSAATWLEVHAPGGGCVEGSVAEDLRAILAQPAEAEGAVPVVCYLRAFQDGTPHWTEDCVCEDAVYPNHDGDETYSMPMVRQADHLAALSAVTAERDGLAAARMAYANEFAPDENGDPDVGNVHANIRALKAERDSLLEHLSAAVRYIETGDMRSLNLTEARAALAAKEE